MMGTGWYVMERQTDMRWGFSRGTLFAIQAFVAVALSIPAAGSGTLGLDVTITKAVQGLDLGPLVGVVHAFNWIGDTPASLALGGLTVMLLAYFHRAFESSLVLATIVVRILNPILKELLASPRPAGDGVEVWGVFDGFGFPSGHSTGALLLYGSLIWVAGRLGPFPGQRLLQALAAAMILGIGFSRIYVGAHWPSDVLGGFLWGSIFLLMMLALCERLWAARAVPTPEVDAEGLLAPAN